MRIAALDIGGTSIKSGIWTGGEVEEVKEWATSAKRGGAYVMERAKEILHTYGTFDAIGISTAGQVDARHGSIRYANENIPGYTGMDVRGILTEEFKVPVAVENDVNAAALGEGLFGAGIPYSDFLCITYGTGVGGAIVIGKEVYKGSSGSAGEFGGMLLHPENAEEGNPFSGCYEKYASVTALTMRAMEWNPELSNGRKIFKQLDNPQVREIVDAWINEIVLGLSGVIHIFNPSCVILGGGVMAQPYVIQEIRRKTKRRIMSSFAHVELVSAQLGNHAGLMGAAYLSSRLLQTGQTGQTEQKEKMDDRGFFD